MEIEKVLCEAGFECVHADDTGSVYSRGSEVVNVHLNEGADPEWTYYDDEDLWLSANAGRGAAELADEIRHLPDKDPPGEIGFGPYRSDFPS